MYNVFVHIFSVKLHLMKVEEIENAYGQTDVVVDEELEETIINLDSSLDSGCGEYEYLSGETTETSSETVACLQLG